jgi:hypothetical protein
MAQITREKAAFVHDIGPARWDMPLQSSVAYGTLVEGTPGPQDTVRRGPTLYPHGGATPWLLSPRHP